MENRINIAELLKDCPTGMELDCLIYDNMYFKCIREHTIYPIVCYTIDSKGEKEEITFNWYGKYSPIDTAKCVIFPKGRNTWKGFDPYYQFKDGDIVATIDGEWIGITTGGEKGKCIPTYCVIKDNNAFEAYLDVKRTWWFNRLATEEEKQKLFNAIKENGYHWNAETKTLEKLPKFKVGDRIKAIGFDRYNIIKNIKLDRYILDKNGFLKFNDEHYFELVLDKFDINTLIPFKSKVLVRHSKDNKWTGSFFSFIDGDLHSHCYKFVTTADKSYPMMIPFKGNEYLLGKTDDCQDFYKTWE